MGWSPQERGARLPFLFALVIANTSCEEPPVPAPNPSSPSAPPSSPSPSSPSSPSAPPSSPSSPSAPPFAPCPNWISTPVSGHLATGLVAVRLDPRDSCADLLVANGNDQWPQPLTLHHNMARKLPHGATGRVPFGSDRTAPEWQGALNAFHGPVATGDLDGDGRVDAVVATIFQPPSTGGRYFPGGLIMHRGEGCPNPTSPRCRGGAFVDPPLATFATEVTTIPRDLVENSTPFAAGHYSWALVLGDVNADGRADIVVGELFDPSDDQPISIREMRRNPPPPGRLRVHLNKPHGFDDRPDWESSEATFVGALEVADMNGDGLLDLVAGSWPPRIYFGRRGDAGVALEHTASWVGTAPAQPSADTAVREFALGLDVGWWVAPASCAPVAAEGSPAPLIAVATGCVFGHGTDAGCEGRFSLFDWRAGGEPIWRSQWRGSGNDIAIADVDGDGLGDLVTTAWSEQPALGGAHNHPGRLRVLGGLPGPVPTFDEARYASATTLIGQQLVVSDLRGERTNAARCSIPADTNPDGTTFMLSAHNLEAITAVDVVAPDGRVGRLTHTDYFTSTGSNVFTLKAPRPPGSSLNVHYDRSDRPSVAVAGLEVCDEACRGLGGAQPDDEPSAHPCAAPGPRKGAVLYFENTRAAGEGLRCGARPGTPMSPTAPDVPMNPEGERP